MADHIAYNPLLVVQRRLGHASPATTYIYLRYLKDPMREVDEAFAEWSAHDDTTYAEIGRQLLTSNEEAAAMPRKGEYRRDPHPARQDAAPARIGLRRLEGTEPSGRRGTTTINPAEFACSALATELADEWVAGCDR